MDLIIRRYLSSEILKTSTSVFIVLLFIALSNEFVNYMTKAASGKLPVELVLNLVALNIPNLLSILLPLGLFIGILLAFGRLYADSEMAVMHASGIGLWDLVTSVLRPAIMLMLFALMLTMWLAPLAMRYQAQLLNRSHSDILSSALAPGRFLAVAGGNTMLFVNSLTSDRMQAQDVFVAQNTSTASADNSNWAVVVAKTAHKIADPDSGQDYLVLGQGHRYSGIPGKRDYKLASFSQFGLRLRKQLPMISNNDVRTKSSFELSLDQADDANELQWRFALPISVIIVALLAVPLSKVAVGASKYSNLFVGIVVIIIYSNMLVLNRAWLQDGIIPGYLGFWLVHCLALIFAVVMMGYRLGFKQWFYKRRAS